MRLQPLEGPRLWTAADYAFNPSVYDLSAAELEEIDAAVRALSGRGLSAGGFERSDFVLPTLGARLGAVGAELLDGRGYVLMRKLPVETYTLEEAEIAYYGLGIHLGVVVSQNGRGDVLTHVTDHGFAPSNPNIRGYQDRRAQPPHTDPTDVVGLLCIRKAKSGGLSSIVNVAALYNEMLAHCPEHLPVLYRGFYMDMRGEAAKEDDARTGTTNSRVPIFSYHQGQLSSWFARRVFESAFAKRHEMATAEEIAALDAMEALSQRQDITAVMDLQPGDVQWVNNYAVMHARTSYEDFKEPDRKRLMVRLWLNLPEQTKLAPDFSQIIRRGIKATASGKLGAELGQTHAAARTLGERP